MRDLSKPIEVQVEGQTLSLRLDMTAMLDFEEAAGLTVAEFVRGIVPVFSEWQEKSAAADSDEDRNAMGLGMIDALLALPVLSARNVLLLAWALAGGEDLGQTPREFGRHVNVASGREIITGVWAAIKGGMPEGDGDDAADVTASEDPT